MNKVWQLVGMSLAPAAAYYLHSKGMAIAILGGVAVGWAVNEYILPAVITAADSALAQ